MSATYRSQQLEQICFHLPSTTYIVNRNIWLSHFLKCTIGYVIYPSTTLDVDNIWVSSLFNFNHIWKLWNVQDIPTQQVVASCAVIHINNFSPLTAISMYYNQILNIFEVDKQKGLFTHAGVMQKYYIHYRDICHHTGKVMIIQPPNIPPI